MRGTVLLFAILALSLVVHQCHSLPLEPRDIPCDPSDGWSLITTLVNPGSEPLPVDYIHVYGTVWKNAEVPSEEDADTFFNGFAEGLGKSDECGNGVKAGGDR